MKAIVVNQPFASLIALGMKEIEVRPYEIAYRGPLLICAGSKVEDGRIIVDGLAISAERHYNAVSGAIPMPLGVSLCVVNVGACTPSVRSDTRLSFTEWNPAAFSWHLRLLYLCDQIPIIGKQGVFEISDALIKPTTSILKP